MAVVRVPKGRIVALAERGVKAEPKSKFDTWIDSLNENNKAVVLGWLHNKKYYSHNDIVRMIRDDDADDEFTGYRTSKGTVSEWREAHGIG